MDTDSVNSLFTTYNSSLSSPKSLKFDIPDTYPPYLKSSLQSRHLHSYSSSSSNISSGSPRNSRSLFNVTPPMTSSTNGSNLPSSNRNSSDSNSSSERSSSGLMSYSYTYSSSTSTLTPISSPQLPDAAKMGTKRTMVQSPLPTPNVTPKASPKVNKSNSKFDTTSRPDLTSHKVKYSSFSSVQSPSTASVLKIKIYASNNVLAIKLRKDKLLNLQDLIKVIGSKISDFTKLSLCFPNKSLSPMPLNDFLQDIIMDYIAAKDKIYIKVD